MQARSSSSLQWRLVGRLLPLQAGLLVFFVFTVFGTMWATGTFTDDAGHPVPATKVLRGTLFVVEYAILPNLVLMTLTTLVAIPIVVRRALARLGDVAKQATEIDVDRRGTRLSVDGVPSEVSALVKAVNDALGRLDEGYERQERFLADAAHELRTPIAILQTRLDSLTDSPEKTRLLEAVARLATVAEELLDLQRLKQRRGSFSRVDLVAIGRCVAIELAPLAIGAGYELVFDPDSEHVVVMGDELALQRALTNLVQNAIEHGGRRGAITIGVGSAGVLQVSDEGPGIPIAQRCRIFEPFHRLQAHPRGAGLGLNLVWEIVRQHNGSIAVVDAPSGGACLRIRLPLHA
jgi:signal transduction histidine kinase